MDEETKYNLELLRALDQLIAEGQWEGGLFFQAAGKKLRELSEQLKQELEIDANNQPSATQMADFIKQRSGLVEIFISLYSAEGNNIRKWEVVLATLTKQLVSRPIYKREKDIRDIINAKENPVNDAYAIVYVTEDSVIKPTFRDKQPVDRFGHELLVLKENSLKSENISQLVHLTGRYAYQNGSLSKVQTDSH